MNWKPLVRSYLVRINELLNDKVSEYSEEYLLNRRLKSTTQQYMHLKKMCAQILAEEAPVDGKYMFGFIHGILWLHGVYSIEELKAHSVAARGFPPEDEAEEIFIDEILDDAPF